MSVYKRAGSEFWQIEFEFKGIRIRRSSGTTVKRQAEELERKLRRELHDQIVMGRGGTPLIELTLREALDRYRDTIVLPKGNARAAQRTQYFLDGLARAFGPDTKLTALSAPLIADYRDRMIRSGKKPATANQYLANLRAVLRKAHSEWGALGSVPTINLLKLNNARYRWLTADEEQRLFALCPDHLRNLLTFLIDTGARLSEATMLTWVDVDLERRPRGMVKFMTTKSGKPRSVPLTERLQALLTELKVQNAGASERVFLYCPKPGVAVPFHRPYGSWNLAVERAGLSDVTIHDLRHTFASRLVMRGVPLLTVSKLLGHATIQMTMRYAHLAPDAFDAAIKALNAHTEGPVRRDHRRAA